MRGEGAPIPPFARMYLDAVRAVAALVVVVGHMQGLFFVDVPVAYTVPSKLFYSLAARSHDAVMVFFVLSGLLVTASASRTVLAGQEGWRSYAVARASRLYTVLLPALLIGAAWDRLGIAFWGPNYGTAAIPVAARAGWEVLLGNLAFLQEILVAPFGSNQPLWSLSYEAWYYLLFPLVIVLCCSARFLFRALAAGAMGGILLCVGWKISAYFFIWLAGSALFFLPRTPLGSARFASGLLGMSFCFIIAAIYAARKMMCTDNEAGWAADMVVAAFVALHLYIALRHPGIPRPRAVQVARWGAGFAFTLYLCHFPLLLFMSFLMRHGKWLPDMLHMGYGAIVVALVVIYSMGIARITEAKTQWVRARFGRMIGRGRLPYFRISV